MYDIVQYMQTRENVEKENTDRVKEQKNDEQIEWNESRELNKEEINYSAPQSK